MPEPVVRGGSSDPVVRDGDPEGAGSPLDGDLRSGSGTCVLHDIGQPLLDDAVCGQAHADRDRAAELVRRLTTGETIRDFPATLRRKDGSLKRVLISSNVRWKDGKFEETRCFTREGT